MLPRVGYAYLRLLHTTMRLEYRNREVLGQLRRERGPYMLAFWHSRLVMMPYAYAGERMVVLSSTHRDSRMLRRVLERFGLDVAWGSSTSGGPRALRELVRRVRCGYDVGMTPDGPRGPRRRVKPGVILVAKHGGLPIVPVAFSARPCRRLASWDRTLLPAPFARGLYVYGDPLDVPANTDRAAAERLRLALEQELDRLTDLADAALGLAPEEARPPAAA